MNGIIHLVSKAMFSDIFLHFPGISIVYRSLEGGTGTGLQENILGLQQISHIVIEMGILNSKLSPQHWLHDSAHKAGWPSHSQTVCMCKTSQPDILYRYITVKSGQHTNQHTGSLGRLHEEAVDCISENLRFEKLSAGSYVLEISADDAQGRHADLVSADLTITSDKKVQLLPNNLRGNYTTALAFFGSPERFMFRYSFREDGKKIAIDSAWIKQYDAEAVVINGKKWRCHVDAVPYFEQAGQYMENTYIRVHGGKLDTGAVRLADLVEMNGTAVRRFVNSGDFVSHHSFGTAVDINAYTPSHRNVLSNREKIYHEVTDNLTYNGIVEVNGKQCYDFTYTGSASAGRKNVPEPLMNYLLYELAFFRAGFSWGLYYPHTCDGMHFSLTELSPTLFEEGPYAMRKVFTYLEDAEATPSPEADPVETELPEETPAP